MWRLYYSGPSSLSSIHMSLSLALLDFFHKVSVRFKEDRGLQLTSSLTFTTLLALVPLLTVMLTMATVFPASSGMTGQVDDFLASHVLPEQIGKTVLRYVDQFSQRAGRLTLIGLAFLAATSFLTMLTIERAFNLIWRTSGHRPFLQRVIVYWGILTLGPVLIGASVTMTSYLVTASMGMARAIPLFGLFTLWFVPFVLTIAAFTLLYYIVPARAIEFKHAFIGGIIAGILFELAKRGFAFYVSRVPTFAMVYGTFATFPIFLLWIYLSWLVAVLGAVVTASLPDFGVLQSRLSSFVGGGFGEILEVLANLAEAHERGWLYSAPQIAGLTRLQQGRCEEILGMLAAVGWAGRVETGHWTLVCSPKSISLAEVIKSFLLDAEAVASDMSKPEVVAVLRKFGADVDHILTMNVRDLLSMDGQD